MFNKLGSGLVHSGRETASLPSIDTAQREDLSSATFGAG